MEYEAILGEYRFTRNDGQPMSVELAQELDGRLFEVIGQFAEANDLAVEGGSLLEHAAAQSDWSNS